MTVILVGSRPQRKPIGDVTVALTVIPALTRTPTQVPTDEDISPESTFPVGNPDSDLSIGAFVKVSGTGGAGLRLRLNPGLEAEPQFLGFEDEIFKIEEGPEEVDGYTWWYLVAPFESERIGWAAANYLEIVQEP